MAEASGIRFATRGGLMQTKNDGLDILWTRLNNELELASKVKKKTTKKDARDHTEIPMNDFVEAVKGIVDAPAPTLEQYHAIDDASPEERRKLRKLYGQLRRGLENPETCTQADVESLVGITSDLVRGAIRGRAPRSRIWEPSEEQQLKEEETKSEFSEASDVPDPYQAAQLEQEANRENEKLDQELDLESHPVLDFVLEEHFPRPDFEERWNRMIEARKLELISLDYRQKLATMGIDIEDAVLEEDDGNGGGDQDYSDDENMDSDRG